MYLNIFSLIRCLNYYNLLVIYREIIETFRRILLTGALVLVDQGSALQIVVAIVLVQIFIKLYGYYAPFDDDYVDVDAEFSQYQLFGVFLIALLIRTGKRYVFLFVCC
jgi:hypothetical protein